MHVADLEKRMLGAQPIVGASVLLGTGAALTAQLTDADWTATVFTGDGSVAEGQVHEAINLAATWQLPVVFVVENNLYSRGWSSTSSTTSRTSRRWLRPTASPARSSTART